jgi:hypothetical protein
MNACLSSEGGKLLDEPEEAGVADSLCGLNLLPGWNRVPLLG